MSAWRKGSLRVEGDQVIDSDGAAHDVHEAIAAAPWVVARKYPPPHEYVVQTRCPAGPWSVLAAFVRHHPESYRAFFRGYQTPNRYVDFEGRRYWMTSSGGRGGVLMVNRALFGDAEPPRRIDQGAVPIPDWQGPPWEPYGSSWPSWYQPGPDGRHVYVPSLDPFRRRRRTDEQT